MPTIRFSVNDEARELETSEQMPLLWALRDLLGLTGTKYGCGVGSCGSCTVHLDGEAVRACQTLLMDVEGRSVTTIEGLAEAGDHPVQRAWEDQDVPQCGYCHAGQIMQAAALVGRGDPVDDQAIDIEMSGNLCRCGTYQRIRAAIHQAAQEVAR